MSSAKWPTKEEFARGQEYVFAVNVHEVNGPHFMSAASFRVTFDGTRYVLEGTFVSSNDAPEHVLSPYLPEERNVREEYHTYSQAKTYAAFFRQRARYSGQVLATI